MTMPKGGSQLIRKAISMISPAPIRQLPSPEEFHLEFLAHLNADPVIFHHHLESGYESIRDSSGCFRKILMIRDPRDVIISMIEWIQVMGSSPLAREFIQLPIEQQMTELIVHPNLQMNGKIPFVFDTRNVVKEALKWIEKSDLFLCRFEDLVGPSGGGSKVKQEETILALGTHMGVDLSLQQVQEIADTLFGDTVTFRKGQIGSWRDLFTPFHKALFKEVMGEELIRLGYESDCNW